jgi:NAD(P)-dependent dehydrogenase (short-subunit alcohol dehydrogenase family)
VPGLWAASYSASKFGLAGFTEALRFELAAHSGIEVCGVYPAYVDTPTYMNSANYTSRTLRPVPPVVPPERVAEGSSSWRSYFRLPSTVAKLAANAGLEEAGQEGLAWWTYTARYRK